MTLEFGRPTSSAQAWYRIPDRSHPDYKIDGGSYESCAHFREFIYEFAQICAAGGARDMDIEERMVPMETDDLRLLFQVNSFYRNIGDAFTVDWAQIKVSEENVWWEVLPFGDDNYRWWQITTLDPDLKFGDFRLYCIEMNDRFMPEASKVRFDERSEFELGFVREEEINSLKKHLSRFGDD